MPASINPRRRSAALHPGGEPRSSTPALHPPQVVR
jgi:hypothetical protein